MATKVCTRCHHALPATRKHFYQDARLSDGLYSHCKDCHYKTCPGEGRTKRAFRNMIQRCYNPNAPSYRWFGAVGVKVCESWRALFENFRSDMGECPEGKSLSRVGAVGNYEPSNCAWMTPAERGVELRKKYRACRICGTEKTVVAETTGHMQCPHKNAHRMEYRKRYSEHHRQIHAQRFHTKARS